MVPAELVGTEIPYRLKLDHFPLTDGRAESASGTIKLWRDDSADFSCAIWGDNQQGSNGDWADDKFLYVKRAFEHMMTRDVDFGVTSGDMASSASYGSQIDPLILQRTDKIFGRTKPYYVAWGNHDTSYTDVMKYFDVESGSYYMYRGNVLFIFVPHAAENHAWLSNLLATPRARAAKFRVLVVHRPLWLEVWGGNLCSTLRDAASAGGVDIVFSGHMHGYERIAMNGVIQLTNGGLGYLDYKEAIINDYGDATFMGGHNAVPYLRAVQSAQGVLGTYNPVHTGCITSYGEMRVKDNVLTYSAHGFNSDGSYIGVFDNFSITSKTVRASALVSTPSVTPCANPASFADCLEHPVTNAKWKEYKDAIGEEFTYADGHGNDYVTSVSRIEIEHFIAWLNAGGGEYRMPTVGDIMLARGNNLAGEISEWTGDVYADRGWCKIVGGNALATPGLWCDPTDKPAIGTPGCFANYLGFRLATGPVPAMAAITGYDGEWDGDGHAASVMVTCPESGYTVKWTHGDDDNYVYDAPESYTNSGVYTNKVRVTAPNCVDFYGTGVVSIATQPMPLVELVSVSDETQSSAVVTANLSSLGKNATSADLFVEYGPGSGINFDNLLPDTQVFTNKITTATATGNYQTSLKGLSPKTHYSVRVIAVNDLDERSVTATTDFRTKSKALVVIIQ